MLTAKQKCYNISPDSKIIFNEIIFNEMKFSEIKFIESNEIFLIFLFVLQCKKKKKRQECNKIMQNTKGDTLNYKTIFWCYSKRYKMHKDSKEVATKKKEKHCMKESIKDLSRRNSTRLFM